MAMRGRSLNLRSKSRQMEWQVFVLRSKSKRTRVEEGRPSPWRRVLLASILGPRVEDGLG